MTAYPTLLRAPEPDDIGFMYRLDNDPALWASGAAHLPYSRSALEALVYTWTGTIDLNQTIRLVADDPADGAPAALVDIYDADARNRRAFIGIAVDTERRGRGLGTRVIEEAGRWCAAQLGLHTLWAVADAVNEASLRAFARAGFCRAATLEQWLARQDGTFAPAALLTKTL